MKDSTGRRQGRHANGDGECSKLDSDVSFMRTSRESYHVLTTNNGDVGLDSRPNIKSHIPSYQVYQADDRDNCDAKFGTCVSEDIQV